MMKMIITKLANLVEGDLKAPFSIATTPGFYKEASSSIFRVFGMTQPEIEPLSLRPLESPLVISPMAQI